MSNIIKSRYFAMILYPESAPLDWQDKLISSGLHCAISPLHDKDYYGESEDFENDINFKARDLKKPHYHIILAWDGPTTLNNAVLFCRSLNQPNPIILQSPSGYFDYLTHKNCPEKAQYDDKDIKLINKFSMPLDTSQVKNLVREIHQIILECDIIEYADLLDLLLFNDDYSLHYEVACNHTLVFTAYLNSRRHKRKEELLNVTK